MNVKSNKVWLGFGFVAIIFILSLFVFYSPFSKGISGKAIEYSFHKLSELIDVYKEGISHQNLQNPKFCSHIFDEFTSYLGDIEYDNFSDALTSFNKDRNSLIPEDVKFTYYSECYPLLIDFVTYMDKVYVSSNEGMFFEELNVCTEKLKSSGTKVGEYAKGEALYCEKSSLPTSDGTDGEQNTNNLLNLDDAFGKVGGFVFGDVDADGNITNIDAILILRNNLGIITLTPEQKERGDVNHCQNGQNGLSNVDAILILRYNLGIITKFPCNN